MKTKKKKIMSFVLVVLMTFCIFAPSVSANGVQPTVSPPPGLLVTQTRIPGTPVGYNLRGNGTVWAIDDNIYSITSGIVSTTGRQSWILTHKATGQYYAIANVDVVNVVVDLVMEFPPPPVPHHIVTFYTIKGY